MLFLNESKRVKPTACIIKGNPDRMDEFAREAKKYYSDIQRFLEKEGFNVVTSESEPYTCPPLKGIAIWVAHSRGVGRLRCIPEHQHQFFAKLGDPDGALNPQDKRFYDRLEKVYFSKGKIPPLTEQPPKDHFIFSKVHKEEVMRVVNNYRKD